MLPERFWSKVEKTPTCWLWHGARSKGYGQFSVNGKLIRAHRLAYEDTVGPIPAGLTLDHLCRVHACVNPTHLEPVDNRTNVLRGVGPSALNARQTHCQYGHRFTESNIYWSPKGRLCRICKRDYLRQWRAGNHRPALAQKPVQL